MSTRFQSKRRVVETFEKKKTSSEKLEITKRANGERQTQSFDSDQLTGRNERKYETIDETTDAHCDQFLSPRPLFSRPENV